MTTKLNAIITQNYRIISDGTQLVLQRRHIADPTKAPGYEAPTDGPTPEPRITWKESGYYPLNSAGLCAATKAAILRDTDVSRAETLAEALRIYADETARLERTIKQALSANFSGEIGALGLR